MVVFLLLLILLAVCGVLTYLLKAIGGFIAMVVLVTFLLYNFGPLGIIGFFGGLFALVYGLRAYSERGMTPEQKKAMREYEKERSKK